jgi:hypothetical protein
VRTKYGKSQVFSFQFKDGWVAFFQQTKGITMKKYLALLILLTLSFSANSALLQDQQFQTTTGQLFTHNLSGPASDGTGGILTVHVRGDFYSGGAYNENYSVSLEGNVLGSGISFDSAGVYSHTTHTFDDHEFSMDFLIGASLLSSVMADLLAVITVDFGSGSNVFNSGMFSEVSLSYNNSVSQVPLPAALFMFAPALLGFMGLRRKAKNSIA